MIELACLGCEDVIEVEAPVTESGSYCQSCLEENEEHSRQQEEMESHLARLPA